MKKIKIYEYAGCSTCKKALKFLDQKKVAYERVPIVERPPSAAEIQKMIDLKGGEFRKLFNTSGQVYREMKLGERVASMSCEEAVKLLAANGKLIKRPFVLTEKDGVVGFNEPEWKQKVLS